MPRNEIKTKYLLHNIYKKEGEITHSSTSRDDHCQHPSEPLNYQYASLRIISVLLFTYVRMHFTILIFFIVEKHSYHAILTLFECIIQWYFKYTHSHC